MAVVGEAEHLRHAEHVLVERHPGVHRAQLDVAHDVVDAEQPAVAAGRRDLAGGVAREERAAVAAPLDEGVVRVAVGGDRGHAHDAVLVLRLPRLAHAARAALQRRAVGMGGVGHGEGDVAHAVAVARVVVADLPARPERPGEHQADAPLLEHVRRPVAHAGLQAGVGDLREPERVDVEVGGLRCVPRPQLDVVDAVEGASAEVLGVRAAAAPGATLGGRCGSCGMCCSGIGALFALRGRGQDCGTICCTAQPLPSGSSKKTKRPQGNSCTSLTSAPRPTSSARAASASSTTICRPLTEPGGMSVDAGADGDRAGRPGRRELHEAQVVAHLWSWSALKPGLLRVEGLGAVHVGHGHRHELELHIHVAPPSPGRARDCNGRRRRRGARGSGRLSPGPPIGRWTGLSSAVRRRPGPAPCRPARRPRVTGRSWASRSAGTATAARTG